MKLCPHGNSHSLTALPVAQPTLSMLPGLRFSQKCCWRFKSYWMWHFITGQTVSTVLNDNQCLHLDPEDQGTTIQWNVDKYWPSNCVSHPSDLTLQWACCDWQNSMHKYKINLCKKKVEIQTLFVNLLNRPRLGNATASCLLDESSDENIRNRTPA